MLCYVQNPVLFFNSTAFIGLNSSNLGTMAALHVFTLPLPCHAGPGAHLDDIPRNLYIHDVNVVDDDDDDGDDAFNADGCLHRRFHACSYRVPSSKYRAWIEANLCQHVSLCGLKLKHPLTTSGIGCLDKVSVVMQLWLTQLPEANMLPDRSVRIKLYLPEPVSRSTCHASMLTDRIR